MPVVAMATTTPRVARGAARGDATARALSAGPAAVRQLSAPCLEAPTLAPTPGAPWLAPGPQLAASVGARLDDPVQAPWPAFGVLEGGDRGAVWALPKGYVPKPRPRDPAGSFGRFVDQFDYSQYAKQQLGSMENGARRPPSQPAPCRALSGDPMAADPIAAEVLRVARMRGSSRPPTTSRQRSGLERIFGCY